MNSTPDDSLASELGRSLPTPLRKLTDPSFRGELWVKDDGRTGESYGGNKVRKLQPIFERALRLNKRRILTIGAAGSHHVLATSIFAPKVGLEVAALLTPQLFTPHVEQTLRAAIGAGLEPLPVASPIDLVRALFCIRRTDLVLGPGAMGKLGAQGFRAAIPELLSQFGDSSPPDKIVVACGSGSTAAGLTVGLAETRTHTKVLAVAVNHNPLLRALVLAQARALARHVGGVTLRSVGARLCVDKSFAGRGYGHPTPASDAASAIGRQYGLALEQTYTAKAFAAALSLARTTQERIVYWHTVSAVPMAPNLARAPAIEELPSRVRQLLIRR